MSDPKSGKDFDEALVSAKRAASVFERCGLVDEVLVGGQAVHFRLRDDGIISWSSSRFSTYVHRA